MDGAGTDKYAFGHSDSSVNSYRPYYLDSEFCDGIGILKKIYTYLIVDKNNLTLLSS